MAINKFSEKSVILQYFAWCVPWESFCQCDKCAVAQSRLTTSGVQEARGLTSAGHRTLLAGFVPGAANVVGAAAHLLGHVEVELAVARHVVGVEVPVAVALPHVCTPQRLVVANKKKRFNQSTFENLHFLT